MKMEWNEHHIELCDDRSGVTYRIKARWQLTEAEARRFIVFSRARTRKLPGPGDIVELLLTSRDEDWIRQLD